MKQVLRKGWLSTDRSHGSYML